MPNTPRVDGAVKDVPQEKRLTVAKAPREVNRRRVCALLLGVDDDLDDLGVADSREFRFQPSRIPNAALRVIDEANHRLVAPRGREFLRVGSQLVPDLSGTDTRFCLLSEDGTVMPWENQRDRGPIVLVRRGPFVWRHFLQLVTEQRAQQVLHVSIVVHVEGGAVFPPQTQLPRDGMKACADSADDVEGIFRLEQSARRSGYGGGRQGRHGRTPAQRVPVLRAGWDKGPRGRSLRFCLNCSVPNLLTGFGCDWRGRTHDRRRRRWRRAELRSRGLR